MFPREFKTIIIIIGVRYHHLDGDNARTDGRQHEPEPQQPEVADNDGDRESDAIDLEQLRRQSVAQRERHNERKQDGNVDRIPAIIANVDVDRVHESPQLLMTMPVESSQTSAGQQVQRPGVVGVEHLHHNTGIIAQDQMFTGIILRARSMPGNKSSD